MRKTIFVVQAGLAILLGSGAAQASAGEAYSPNGLRCVTKPNGMPAEEDVNKVGETLRQRFDTVWGKDKWIGKPIPSKRIDPKAMEEIAAVSACGALMDQSSCSTYFDPEFGGEPAIFMNLSTKVPVRKQFDEAIAALPSAEARKAAQYCIKLVGKK
ncbi:hypothetical protein ACN9MZ_21075 [Pseudoduganella sp. S-14]|jgi:hypothetical protein|uniref:hypothetical protein n=1 Tax=Pseudoduganella sp. S-14 TaxID=3404065 RepID=UPI003CEDDEF5